MKTLEDMRNTILQRVSGCDDPCLLDEIERLLEREEEAEPLLTLDDEDIRALLRELLDE